MCRPLKKKRKSVCDYKTAFNGKKVANIVCGYLYDHSTDFQRKSILRALRQQKEKRDTHLNVYQTWHMCYSHNTVVMDYERVMDVHCET